MTKKVNLALVAAVFVAVVLPAAAAAAPEITVGGKIAPLGTKLALHTGNFKIETSLGDITCETVETDQEVKSNTGSHIEAKTPTFWKAADCTLNKLFVTPTELEFAVFTSNSKGKGAFAFDFEIHVPGLTKPCHFISTGVPFTYTSGSNSMNLTKADLVSTPTPCEPGLFSADITVTSAGGAVVLH